MGFPRVEQLVEQLLSLFERWSYVDTARDLRKLFSQWKKERERLYAAGQQRDEFVKWFDSIRTYTLLPEFCKLRGQRGVTEDIYREVDDMFAGLAHKANRNEISGAFGKIIPFDALSETESKLHVLFETQKGLTDVCRFYILCFAYMIAMEGYYDELIRFVYGVRHFISTSEVLEPDSLKYKPVNEMYPALEIHSANIASIWDTGHHVRNAIAHARFTYIDKERSMRFVDLDPQKGNVKFDITLTFVEVDRMYGTISNLGEVMKILLNLWFTFNLLTIPPERIALV